MAYLIGSDEVFEENDNPKESEKEIRESETHFCIVEQLVDVLETAQIQTAEYQKWQKQLHEEKNVLSRRIDEMKEREKVLEAKIAELERDLGANKAELNKANIEKRLLQDEIHGLKQQLKQANGAIPTTNAETFQTPRNPSSAKEKKKDVERKKADVEKKKKDLKKAKRELNAGMGDLGRMEAKERLRRYNEKRN